MPNPRLDEGSRGLSLPGWNTTCLTALGAKA